MGTKHTPGPLYASCDLDDCDEVNAIITKDGVVVGYVVDAPEIRRRHNKGKVEGPGCQAGPDALDEADANARLWAAAPELLKALEEARHCLRAITLKGEYEDVLEQCAAAIAKAKGGAE